MDGPANKRIISNRIRLLARKEKRKFVHKDARGGCDDSSLVPFRNRGYNDDENNKHWFDPIRMKIRIMPTTRAPKG